MPFPVYSILHDTLNGKVTPGNLHIEIKSLGILAFVGVSTDEEEDKLVTMFDQDISTEDQSRVTSVVAAHDGGPAYKTPVYRASSKLVEGEKEIVESTWVDAGGVVTNVAFFTPNVTNALGRIVGEIKTNGIIDLRLVQEDDTVLGSLSVADTGDIWTKFSFTTTPGVEFPYEEQLFRLQVKLNGATSAIMRFVSMTLLELE